MIDIATALTVYYGDKKESFLFVCFAFYNFKNIFSFGQASLAQVLGIRVQGYSSLETLGELFCF